MNKNIFEYTDFRKFLSDYYHERKKAQPGFSHRLIGNRVGFSAGYFSRILSGSKPLSEKLILNFCAFLKLSKKEALYFEAMVRYNQARSNEERRIYYERMILSLPQQVLQLSKDQLAIFTESYYCIIHAILYLYRVDNNTDLSKIGNLLIPPISAAKVKGALKLLERLNLIGQDHYGNYKVKETFLSSILRSDERVVRSFLNNAIMQAGNALWMFPPDKRPTSTMVISVSEQGFLKIKDLLDTLRRDINQVVREDEHPNQIQQISYQMFPVSKIIKGDLE